MTVVQTCALPILDAYELREDGPADAFETLVPDLAAARRRRERRYKGAQVNPDDGGEVAEMLELESDESVGFEEE